MLGVPVSIRSHISAVSSQPSPIVLHRLKILPAFSASSKTLGYGSKRVDFWSILLMGSRNASIALMPVRCVKRLMALVPSSSFMLMALVMPKRKKSTRPGTLASQPSCSITRTTWLFAVGWNLTRISPTTPTRGLERSLVNGSASNASTVFWQSW